MVSKVVVSVSGIAVTVPRVFDSILIDLVPILRVAVVALSITLVLVPVVVGS